jgi:endonuclease/exonuclease/phosphatase family metal-dependent hydrolase
MVRRALPLLLGFLACSPASVDGQTPTEPSTEADAAPKPTKPKPSEDAAIPSTSTDAGSDTSAPFVPGGQLTVLSLNLHCLKTEGTVFPTNTERFAAIARAVATEDVDVVLAQEVCSTPTANARTMLTEALGRTTGTPWSSTNAFAHRAWEGTSDEADESLAIFSRGALTAPRETVHRVQGTLRRVTLGATVASRMTTVQRAALPVRVYTVHLDYSTPSARGQQGREVASAAMFETDTDRLGLELGGGAVSLPVLVGGDFNALSADPAPQALRDFGFLETSGSASTRRIDHVFVHRSAPFTQASSKVLFEGAQAVSDHPGVLVRYLPGAPKPVKLTRIVARGAFPALLSVRGDRAPLSWEQGWPAFPTVGAPASVSLVTSEVLAGPFAYKFLRQDSDWANGTNVNGMGETDNASSPTFP